MFIVPHKGEKVTPDNFQYPSRGTHTDNGIPYMDKRLIKQCQEGGKGGLVFIGKRKRHWGP